jgi:hypothetical protein
MLEYALVSSIFLRDQVIFGHTFATVNALSDWIMVAMPLFLIERSLKTKRAKACLILILLFGVIGSAASLAGFVLITHLENPIGSSFKKQKTLQAIVVVEPGLCIFAISLITLGPLFRQWLGTVSKSWCPQEACLGIRLIYIGSASPTTARVQRRVAIRAWQ